VKREHKDLKSRRPLGTKLLEKPYRVFISYSREDLKWVKRIVAVLRCFADPMWDEDFRYGQGFHEQIQMFIAHSHVFLPVITKQSSKRRWVHEEIGYAKALNIPVLPICLGEKALPDAMIQSLQAVRLSDDGRKWASQLRRLLTTEVLESLVSDFADQEYASFQCAEDTEDRARLLAVYCDTVRKLGRQRYGMVRQAGGLSSFHIPSEPISHSIWKARYGKLHQSVNHCRWLRKEKQALSKHARRKGCRLIVNPNLSYDGYGLPARIARLQWLVNALRSFRALVPAGVQVAFDPPLDKRGTSSPECVDGDAGTRKDFGNERSVTIVGNWFAAESVSAAIGQGYRHTIFTRHAPSVQSKIELFDEEFKQALKASNWNARQSCSRAILELDRLIKSLKRKQAKQP